MEKAKALASEVLGDQTVSVIFLVNGSQPSEKLEVELIASWLAELGLDITIQPMEGAALREEAKQGNYGIARMQQGLSNSEPATIFRRFMLTTGDHNKNYNLGYQSDEVDSLMAEASGSADLVRITEIYDRIQEISTQEFPIIPLYNDQTVIAYSKKLTGYEAKLYGIDLPKVSWVG